MRDSDEPYLADEAAFRAEYGWCMDALREMKLGAAVRPKLMDALERRISWEEFRE